jgi:hypothetical protein
MRAAGASIRCRCVAPSDLLPSSGLRRAATAERERIRRARERLAEREQQLHAELAAVRAEIRALDDRDRLLINLIAAPEEAPLKAMSRVRHAVTEDVDAAITAPGRTTEGARSTATACGSAPSAGKVLRGRDLREAATRVLFLTRGPDREVHYREWLDEVLRAGIDVVGKDPVAAFLTNVSRSPIVVRGDEPGAYRIDSSVAAKLHRELAEAEAELADVVAVIAREPNVGTDLREHRARLSAAVRRLEGQVAEADRVMAPHAGRDDVDDIDDDVPTRAAASDRSAARAA